MRKTNEHIRAHLLRDVPESMPDVYELGHSEWSGEFERAMRNALIQGAFRYGMMTPGTRRHDRVKQMRERVERYVATGHRDLLVDIANFALLEFEEQ